MLAISQFCSGTNGKRRISTRRALSSQIIISIFHKHASSCFPDSLLLHRIVSLLCTYFKPENQHKVDLAHVLEYPVKKNDPALPRTWDTVIYDDEVRTNILKPQTSKLFEDNYINNILHICKNTEAYGCRRIVFYLR